MLRTTEKQVKFFESCSVSSSCIPWHTVSIEFSCDRDPDQLQQTLACIFAIMHRDNIVDTFRMYSFNLFTSGGEHEIFWQISSVDIIPEPSSLFQDLIILERDFWCWACNLFNCVQLVILFELFTKCLQNRCYQFWWVCVINNMVCISRFIQFPT